MRSKNILDEISDGKLYDIGDMVKADTGGCTGCSDCFLFAKTRRLLSQPV